jgi:asparagine synthase (glutamine-hydrolysing)
MCGIAGILSINNKNIQQSSLQAMANAMAHRGPNGEGFYINTKQQIGFAHRRLSIIDLSIAGTQPMHYLQRYTIVHNGEIYNYVALKKALQQKGYSFTTATDTEVILAAYDCYKEECLQYFDGMFAFAIWDEQEQQLFAARDRFGEKPFYYFYDNESFYFASEMKALWAAGVPKVINPTMLCMYLGTGYTNIPLEPQLTFYKSIDQLKASNYIVIKCNNNKLLPQINTYWDIDKVTTTQITEAAAIEKYNELLQTSISNRLRSDVAIGTSLSGGLDSGSIVAILQQIGVNNYQSFSAVFPGYAKNEMEYIKLVNDLYQLESNFVAPSANDFCNDFDKIITIQEQPFISSSIYAQYKVMQLAKQQNVTVLLDGQGADETMGGYTKYIHWYLQELFLYDKKLFQQEVALYNYKFGLKNKMAAWFPAAASTQLQKNVTKQVQFHNFLTPEFVSTNFSKLLIHKPLVKKLNDLLYYNSMEFGLAELLRYADKNAMANGVEVRLPYLQHELVQFVFSLPSNYKMQNGYTKTILRKTVDKKLPDAIVWNKNKIGYETPQQEWLQQTFFVEKINAAKQKLVANGILQNTVLKAKTITEQDWRMMIAAEYL